MNNTLANIWLFATHWTKLDAFDTEEELNDELELLQRQSLPTKVRQVTDKEGREQFLLYVKQADRDYARYWLAARRDDVIHPCKKENLCQNRKSNFRITLIIHG